MRSRNDYIRMVQWSKSAEITFQNAVNAVTRLMQGASLNKGSGTPYTMMQSALNMRPWGNVRDPHSSDPIDARLARIQDRLNEINSAGYNWQAQQLPASQAIGLVYEIGQIAADKAGVQAGNYGGTQGITTTSNNGGVGAAAGNAALLAATGGLSAFFGDTGDTHTLLHHPAFAAIPMKQKESIVDSIEASRMGDQNATALIAENARKASKGDPSARIINQFVRAYTSKIAAGSTAHFGKERASHPSARPAHKPAAHPAHAARKPAHKGAPHPAHKGAPHPARDAQHLRRIQNGKGGNSHSGASTSANPNSAPAQSSNPNSPSMKAAARELESAAHTIAQKYGVGPIHALKAAHTHAAQASGSTASFGTDLRAENAQLRQTIHKLANIVALSHGPALTNDRIRQMTASFGSDAAAEHFIAGLRNPDAPIRVGPSLSRLAAECIRSGQCVAKARQLQSARMPGGRIADYSQLAASELGSMVNAGFPAPAVH